VPKRKAIHAIVDNYATHKHPKVRRWLARHPRWTFHFTPTSASWLNAVEGSFAKLTKRRLKRGVFRSLPDLQAAINRFVAETNKNPKSRLDRRPRQGSRRCQTREASVRVDPLAAVLIALGSTFVYLFAGSTFALFMGRFLNGLALGVGSGTATAWLAELLAPEDSARSANIATTSNFLGLGVGSLLSGLLAQYLPWPLYLCFIVYLIALRSLTNVRSQCIAPTTAGSGAMPLVGFYAANCADIAGRTLARDQSRRRGCDFL